MAQALFVVLAVLVTVALRPRGSSWDALRSTALNDAVAAYEEGGAPKAAEYLDGLQSNQHVRAYLFDDQGDEVSHRGVPDWAVRIVQRTPLDRLGADLARYPQLQFIDLREPLRAAKGGERLYYQTDSHWNYLGATVGYQALMSKVALALPGLTVAPVTRPAYVPGVDYYSGDLAQMLGLQRQFRETDIAPLGKILATPESRCAKQDTVASTPVVEAYVYRCPNAPRFTALVYRDSMAIPLIPMLAENFSRTTFVSSAQLDPALVERLQPDIVIEESVERGLAAPVAFPMAR